MNNEINKAELADILFATVNREMAKPEKEINIRLIDYCLEFAEKLGMGSDISDEEVKQRAEVLINKGEVKKHKRKHLRIRLIAAILALLVLMGGMIYTYYDEIEEMFNNAKTGVRYSNEKYDFELTDSGSMFSTTDELTKSIDSPIWFPCKIPKGYVLNSADLINYIDYDQIIVSWKNNEITFTAQIGLKHINVDSFNNHKYEYSSKNGHEYNIVDFENQYQANTIIDNVYYTIKTKDIKLLYDIIDSMELIE